MTSETGQQIITIHILPNISKSKGNQTMIKTLHLEQFQVNPKQEHYCG